MRLWLVLLAASAATLAAAQERPALVRTGFEDGLAGWEQRGAAQFALDPAEHHGGQQSLRITVEPGAALSWQQAARLFGPVAKGDTFTVKLWVRSRGVADGSGAYAALEFVNAQDQRVGIEHSTVSAQNGAGEWQALTIEGKAPEGTTQARLSLVLNSHATAWFDDVEVVLSGHVAPWPDKGGAVRAITITDQVTQPHFGGVGYHVFDHTFPATDTELNEVILKRWREVAPSFARLNDATNWTPAEKERVAWWMQQFKATGTEMYVATWGPKETAPGAERAAYARQRADDLAWFVQQKGITNLRWYCLTNELSLKQWGSLKNDLDTFRDYHRELRAAFDAKGLKIGLLATDASPVGWWDTIEWATQHMDEITAIYGGHEYFNSWDPSDETFYEWFHGKLAWAVGVARAKGKDFLLGEFGGKQDGRTIDGLKLDDCAWFGTEKEPLVALQLGDTVIGALNAGVYSLASWTFMDFPDYSKTYENKWGLFKRKTTPTGVDFGTRAHYYGYGLLSKFLRGPSTVYRVDTDDPWLRAGALVRNDTGGATIAVINRFHAAVPLKLSLGKLPTGKPYRRYVYDPAHVPQNAFGDLQAPSGTLAAVDGSLTDTIGPNWLVVYTTAYDDQPPAAPRGLTVAPDADGAKLTWQANAEPDLCYYRVYHGDEEVGTTIATTFTHHGTEIGTAGYRVVAVDSSGNASR